MDKFDALREALGFPTPADEAARIAARIEADRAAERDRLARIEQDESQRATDLRRAQNLRRTSHLNTRKPGTGPRVAR